MPDPPRIVFLDSSTMTAGDMDFSVLRQCGKLTLHETSTPQEVTGRIAGARIVITNKVVLDAEILAHADELQLIIVCATGVNNIDLTAAKSRNIAVSNVAGYSTASVAQHALSLLLNLAGNTHRYAAEAALWPQSPIFTRLTHPMTEMDGKILGIAGAGNIGCSLGKTVTALGMNVQVLARQGSLTDRHPEWPRIPHQEFFSSSDVISLHCPLTTATRHMINSTTLHLMKQSAFLVNTGRGELIDEPALAESLRTKSIAGAALDVLSREPPSPEHSLLAVDIPNLLITPHSAWSSREARNRLLDGIVNNLRTYLAGTPANRII